MQHQAIDNYLEPYQANQLERTLLGKKFPWYFQSHVLNSKPTEASLNDFQFTHTFIREGQVTSDLMHIIAPLLERLQAKSIQRIKANLTGVTSSHYESGWHVDTNDDSKTAVYYVNTNNGYTVFESGEKVESVKNRFVSFDSDQVHSGATCTDSKARVVVNINYRTDR